MSRQILKVNAALLDDPAPVSHAPRVKAGFTAWRRTISLAPAGLVDQAACNALVDALQAAPARQRRSVRSQGARAASM